MKGIRFDISDDLHRKLRTKLASEGRQAKDLYIALTEIYVGENETTKNRPQKSGQESRK